MLGVCIFTIISFHKRGFSFNLVSASSAPSFCISDSATLQSMMHAIILIVVGQIRKRWRAFTLSSSFIVSSLICSSHSLPLASSLCSSTSPAIMGNRCATCRILLCWRGVSTKRLSVSGVKVLSGVRATTIRLWKPSV